MLSFKEQSDWQLWRDGLERSPADIPNQPVRDWITQFNAVSEQITGKSAVVTSWYRDELAHKAGYAVDFRRLSGANRVKPKYSEVDVEALEKAAVAIGIPVVVIYRGQPSEHWHCGEIATLAYG